MLECFSFKVYLTSLKAIFHVFYINNRRFLQNNELSGPIPDDIGELSELQTLDLSNNQFVGGIPSSLGSLTHLNYL